MNELESLNRFIDSPDQFLPKNVNICMNVTLTLSVPSFSANLATSHSISSALSAQKCNILILPIVFPHRFAKTGRFKDRSDQLRRSTPELEGLFTHKNPRTSQKKKPKKSQIPRIFFRI